MSLTVGADGHWRPAKKGDDAFNYAVEYSKSGQSRCRKCSDFIPKAVVRFGIPIRHANGMHGYISAWQHLKCSRVEERDGELESSIHGLGKLKPEDRVAVLAEVVIDTPPQHLESLSPDDLIRRGVQERVEPPSTMLQQLLPFQKEGLGWMSSQELSEYKGGILADEMGMGKTIQTISMMLRNKGTGPTLVVCPVSSMLQWQEEINTNVVEGALTVYVASSTCKIQKELMERADVVLTSYQVLELSWRTITSAGKVPCQYCKKSFVPRKLQVHNKYFCGPKAKKTAKQSKQESTNSKRQQSKATIRKGLQALRVDLDDDDEEEEVKVEAVPLPARKGTISGPMDMYRELMTEAGREVRSRWDRKREREGSDTEGNGEGGTSSIDEEEDAEEADGANLLVSLFHCDDCGFQKLRFPFCPKTGQEHTTLDPEAADLLLSSDVHDVSKSIFHDIKWFRVVLDEAHRIKTRTTGTARSIYSLKAERRWCLTGTPLLNRVGDLYSLLRFLQVEPYSKYSCQTKGCSCTSLSHPFSRNSLRACVYCGHGPLMHSSYFNKHIMNPINRYGYVGDGKKALLLLSNNILNALMLRRTKVERAHEMTLPPMTVTKRMIEQSPEERDLYESLYRSTTNKFDTFVKKGTVLHNYAHIFQLLSRLRQALCHPYLVTRLFDNIESTATAAVEKDICAICRDRVLRKQVTVDPCRHAFHASCLGQFVDGAPEGGLCCPACFVPVTFDMRRILEIEEDADDDDGDGEEDYMAAPPTIQPSVAEEDSDEDIRPMAPPGATAIGAASSSSAPAPTSKAETATRSAKGGPRSKGFMNTLDVSKFVPNTKLKAILEYVQGIPAGEKAILFSQFGVMLDLIEHYISVNGIVCVKLTGALRVPVRQSVIAAFRSDPKVKVILISLKAGGEGLNLQNANHVMLCDPWWNPAVEMQAVQRAHRIGQTLPVTAVRLVTANSVEERMMELQEKKMLVFEGTIDGKATSLHRLSAEDMQFLFSH